MGTSTYFSSGVPRSIAKFSSTLSTASMFMILCLNVGRLGFGFVKTVSTEPVRAYVRNCSAPVLAIDEVAEIRLNACVAHAIRADHALLAHSPTSSLGLL
jgi:hypothetical protein